MRFSEIPVSPWAICRLDIVKKEHLKRTVIKKRRVFKFPNLILIVFWFWRRFGNILCFISIHNHKKVIIKAKNANCSSTFVLIYIISGLRLTFVILKFTFLSLAVCCFRDAALAHVRHMCIFVFQKVKIFAQTRNTN